MESLRTSVDVSSSVWGKLEHTGWIDENMSWKQTCYIGDWSWLDEFHIKGSDALKFFSDFVVNSLAKFDIGQAKHAVMCNNDGRVIGEGILMRFSEDEIEFQARGPVTTWLEYNFQKGQYNAEVTLVISKFKYQVQGPNSLHVIEKAAGESIRDIGFMHFRKIHINGREVWALRQGMSGEIGYELQGPAEYGSEIYNTILKVGKEFGIRRMGSRVAMMNHLEACFPTITHDYLPAICGKAEKEYFDSYNIEMTDGRSRGWFRSFDRCLKVKGSFEADDISAWYRSPVELGWTKEIKFDHDFYGREALEAEVAHPRRTIVTLVWNADDVIDVVTSLFRQGEEPYDFMDMPRHQWFCMYANKVLKGDQLVGVMTSRGFSYYFRQMLSLCTIDIDFSKPGTEVAVVWGDPGTRQKHIRATVAPAPYKKDNRRIDVTKLLSYLK
jgi:vanillate/3-O-methylgallate O-demethylase